MGHEHAQGRAVDRSRLRLVLAVTLVVIVVELVGAWVSGSWRCSQTPATW